MTPSSLKTARKMIDITQEELASKLHLTKQMLYMWESGSRIVTFRYWEQYMHELRLSESEFEDCMIGTILSRSIETLDPSKIKDMYDCGHFDAAKLNRASSELARIINSSTPLPPPELTSQKIPDGLEVPIISQAAASTCNPGLQPLLDCVEEQSSKTIFFPKAKKGDFAIEVSGTSMSPWYPDGTLLLVRPYTDIQSGKRVVAVLDTGEIVFKIYAEKGDKVCLLSIDPNGTNFVYTKPLIKIRYICRVIASIRMEDDLDEEMRHANVVHGWQNKLDTLTSTSTDKE